MYLEFKKKQQEEFNRFPIGFAFNKKQFAEMMSKWDLKITDTDKILSIGAGGYIRKSDREAFTELLKTQSEERTDAMQDDVFLLEALEYELTNHEYSYTHDPEEALNALGFSYGDLDKDYRLKSLLKKAIKNVLKRSE